MTNRSNKSSSSNQSPSQQASSRSGSQKSDMSSDRRDLSGSQGQTCPPGQRPGSSDDEEE